MALLVDGYNLLHVTDIFGDGTGPTPLAGSREALLDFLASALEKRQLSQTTIVFDAADAPPGLPRSTTHDGMTILYARGFADADAMLEDLIERHEAPRSLLVVSSDHRIQRAARKRGAQYVDSESWYRELVDSLQAKPTASSDREPKKPRGKPSPEEVAYWTRKFELPPESPPKPPRDNIFPEGYADDVLNDPEGTP